MTSTDLPAPIPWEPTDPASVASEGVASSGAATPPPVCGKCWRRERDLKALRRNFDRLTSVADCPECDQILEDCADQGKCGRCNVCYLIVGESCECQERCPVCQGWKCDSRVCKRIWYAEIADDMDDDEREERRQRRSGK